MGTELHCALNLLATLPNKNSDALNKEINSADFWAYSRKRFLKENLRTGFDQFQASMDRLVEQCNKESVRKTMLKQEEIFKEQVKELHRLYRVQKILMDELRNKELKFHSLTNVDPVGIPMGSNHTDLDRQMRYWSPRGAQTSHSYLSSNYHPAVQSNSQYHFHQRCNIRSDPSTREPSTCSGDTFRMHRGFDLERPTGGDTSTNASTTDDHEQIFSRPMKDKMAVDYSHDSHYQSDEECDIELTLSVGYRSDKKKRKHRPHLNLELSCPESTPNETRQLVPSMPIRSDREKEHSDRPHWLFQTLSWNKT